MAKDPTVTHNKSGEQVHHSVGAIIKNREGKYLLIDRKNPPHGFACIAGHIDESETHIEAIEREVYEESGFKSKHQRLVEEKEIANNVCKSGIKIHFWYLFECECNGTPWLNEDEAHSIAWYSQEEVQILADEGKLEPVWNFWLKRHNVIIDRDKVREITEDREEASFRTGLPADKRKGVCQEDNPEKRCDFLILSSEGWVCEKSTDLGEAIKEYFKDKGKELQDNC
ncbi:NUDIX hydrolase [Candidatus Parcubacteria bacterium]|nr:NUDIX hydrolase [Patescibacteria group bacterium]MCG2693895.1 NUDIX hydrolase [Candidatus Parcubacteria bacterium]